MSDKIVAVKIRDISCFKVAKSSIITSLLVMLVAVVVIGIYVLNPQKKATVRNEPIVAETPVATESPKAEVSEDSIYPETYSEVVPSY